MEKAKDQELTRKMRECTMWPLIWQKIQEIEEKVQDRTDPETVKVEFQVLRNYLKVVDISETSRNEVHATYFGSSTSYNGRADAVPRTSITPPPLSPIPSSTRPQGSNQNHGNDVTHWQSLLDLPKILKIEERGAATRKFLITDGVTECWYYLKDNIRLDDTFRVNCDGRPTTKGKLCPGKYRLSIEKPNDMILTTDDVYNRKKRKLNTDKEEIDQISNYKIVEQFPDEHTCVRETPGPQAVQNGGTEGRGTPPQEPGADVKQEPIMID